MSRVQVSFPAPIYKGSHCFFFLSPREQGKRRYSQVVRPRSAKPLFTGSNPVAASIIMPVWRNWQTRTTQNRVPWGVSVRPRPPVSDDSMPNCQTTLRSIAFYAMDLFYGSVLIVGQQVEKENGNLDFTLPGLMSKWEMRALVIFLNDSSTHIVLELLFYR